MLREFYSDPLYLFRYYAATLLAYIVAVAALLPSSSLPHLPHSWAWLLVVLPLIVPTFHRLLLAPVVGAGMVASGYFGEFSLGYLLLIPLGIYFGIMSATFMHIASHRGIKPQWLNRLVGELCAIHQLSVFKGWTIVHLLHHQNPDDPKFDPHPPQGFGFVEYVAETKRLMQKCMTHTFLRKHGDSPESRKIWARTEGVLVTNRIVRAVFWLVVLGPAPFACFYVPSLAVNILLYAHFNYSTHRPNPNTGEMEILNLDHNLLYRFLNLITFGGYYHKNHHLKPSLFNPKALSQRVPEGVAAS
jgi:stearoyl-CoA desaturase (delta-9 desaturase)